MRCYKQTNIIVPMLSIMCFDRGAVSTEAVRRTFDRT